ncbi:UNVERIFIED_CONTAM: hypothetical protein RMT77_001221 [Armadillidium vulgare]
MVVTLGYWKLRGLGQSIKLILEYTGTEYKEKQYVCGPAPDFDGSDWTNEKFNLGMDFPNIPYYFDGERKITQSHAILRHIARKHNLTGKTECENVRIDMSEGEAGDLRSAWVKLVYSSKEEFEKSKGDYKKNTLLPKLTNLSKFLGNHPWFAGEHITYVDFLLYELFDINRRLFPSCLDDFDNLKQYTKRFESLEPIKKYMNSNRYMKDPLNGPMAAFGGK